MAMNGIRMIYASPSGTTKNVVELVSSVFDRPKNTYDLLVSPLKEKTEVPAEEAVVVGMPVFSGRVPAVFARQLQNLKGNNTPAIAVVVYGNRAYDDALLELKNIFETSGFIVVAAAAFVARHSVFPSVAADRPDESDRKIISAFADRCREKLETFTPDRKQELKVSGNQPYREPSAIPLKPSGNNKCNKCMVCVKICPAGAISQENPRKTDKNLCFSCTACIYICSQRARAFHGPLAFIARKMFEKKCKRRCEPEIFD